MGGEEPLRLSGRLEPAHALPGSRLQANDERDLFSSSRWPDRSQAIVSMLVDGKIIELGTNGTKSLDAGETDTNENLSFKVPDGLAPGRYLVSVWVDKDREVAEEDENNNIQSFWIDIEPSTPLPTLSLHDGGFVDEGNDSESYARLSHAVDYDVTFTVSTWYSVFNEANAGGHGQDYETKYVDYPITIKAGTTIEPIPVWIKPDTVVEGYERFELRVDTGIVDGAVIGTDRAAITIRDTTPVPERQAEGPAQTEGDISSSTPQQNAASIQSVVDQPLSETLKQIKHFIEGNAHLTEVQKREQLAIIENLNDLELENYVRGEFWKDFDSGGFLADQPEFAVADYLESKGLTGSDYRIAAGSIPALETTAFALDKVGGIVGLAATAAELGEEHGDPEAQSATLMQAAFEVGLTLLAWPVAVAYFADQVGEDLGIRVLPFPDPFGDDPNYSFTDLVSDFFEHNAGVYAGWVNAGVTTFADGLNWLADGLGSFQPSDWDDATHQTSTTPVADGIYYTPWQNTLDEYQQGNFGTGGSGEGF